MKQRWKIIMLFFLLALPLGMLPWTTQAAAVEVILAETSGFDNLTGPDYYGVHYQPGGTSFIQSVTFDISGDPDGFFDFDGADNFGNATAPVLSGITVGLTAGDITFSFSNFVGGNPAHPQVLTATFAPGAFGPGDSLHFAADTDFYRQDPTPGGVFGLPGPGRAIFSSVLASGQSFG
jgi:hypothetical protein